MQILGYIEKELSDSKMNQIALYSYNNTRMLPNRCHDNRLITDLGVFTPYFSGRLLFPLAP